MCHMTNPPAYLRVHLGSLVFVTGGWRVTGGEQYLSQELRTAVRPRAREWSPERSLEAVGVAGPSPV